jgi:hypothetical protein
MGRPSAPPRRTEADALREELAALRRRLAAAEARERQMPEAVPLARPVIASPVVGHSTAPLATITHVQAAVRGNQARQDPARALERAHSVLAPADMLARADSLRPIRSEGDDVEAARPPEAAAEARAAQKKLQADRHGWATGTALLIVLLELFALLDNRHWAVATLREAGDDVELSFDLHGWTAAGHHTAAAPTPAPTRPPKQHLDDLTRRLTVGDFMGRELEQAPAETNATRRRSLWSVTCPDTHEDVTGGDANWWECGGGCAGGTYTDGTCGCACQCKTGNPVRLVSSSGPCCEPGVWCGDYEGSVEYAAEGRGCTPCRSVSKGACPPGTDFSYQRCSPEGDCTLGPEACTYMVAARAGAALCLAVAVTVMVLLNLNRRVCPGRWWTLERNFMACGWALFAGGVVAVGTASNFVHENKRRFPGDGLGNDDECGRGCADAHAGGIVAIVAGLAMVASQGASPKFPDCLLAVGYLLVVVFIILTAIGAVWNWLVGLFS